MSYESTFVGRQHIILALAGCCQALCFFPEAGAFAERGAAEIGFRIGGGVVQLPQLLRPSQLLSCSARRLMGVKTPLEGGGLSEASVWLRRMDRASPRFVSWGRAESHLFLGPGPPVVESGTNDALRCFVLADRLDRFIGDSGRAVLTRLLGILLAALSVQFIADGAKQLFS